MAGSSGTNRFDRALNLINQAVGMLRRGNTVITMGATGLNNSYRRALVSLEFGSNECLLRICPFCRKRSGHLEIFRLLLDQMPFLHEYLFKIRHRRAVLCDERQDFAYLLCISQ